MDARYRSFVFGKVIINNKFARRTTPRANLFFVNRIEIVTDHTPKAIISLCLFRADFNTAAKKFGV